MSGGCHPETGWSGWTSPTDGPMQMLYDCENVRTVLSPAKHNTPPMKAFRAPGFVEGTFGLECLLDELAARLEIDPLELRRRNYAHSTDDRPYSSKNLMECYKRAEPHWQRRDEVRARSEGPWKRGVGLASQIWYGGGGPPSYAWVRLGSDGRATVVTAMQDIGTGTATTMTQIAAEQLGLPLDRVEVVLGDSARGPYASISAGSSTTPSMGPAVRSAAAPWRRGPQRRFPEWTSRSGPWAATRTTRSPPCKRALWAPSRRRWCARSSSPAARPRTSSSSCNRRTA